MFLKKKKTMVTLTTNVDRLPIVERYSLDSFLLFATLTFGGNSDEEVKLGELPNCRCCMRTNR